MPKKKEIIGVLQILASGICFGFLGIFGRWAFQSGLTVGELLTFRFTIAFVLLWGVVLFLKRKLFFISVQQILISVGLGVFGYAVFSTMYFKAIQGVSVPLAALLLFTFPIFVNIGAHLFLKEKLSSSQLLSLFVSSCGLLILLWGDFSVQKISSIFWGLGAAVTYSIYVLVSGRFQKSIHPLSSSLYVIFAATVTLWLFHKPSIHQMFSMTQQQWLIIIGIATICTLLPLGLFLAGLQKMKSSKASILVMIEPVTAALASSIFLNETLSGFQILGALLVLSGLLIDALSK